MASALAETLFRSASWQSMWLTIVMPLGTLGIRLRGCSPLHVCTLQFWTVRPGQHDLIYKVSRYKVSRYTILFACDIRPSAIYCYIPVQQHLDTTMFWLGPKGIIVDRSDCECTFHHHHTPLH